MREITCLSVIGGWQSMYSDTNETLGPIFRNITDLWNWQRNFYFV